MKRLAVDMSKDLNSLVARAIIAAGLVFGTMSATTHAVIDFKRGDAAPPLALATTAGAPVKTTEMAGQPIVILFGLTGQENTARAMEQISKCVNSPTMASLPNQWLMIYSKSSELEKIEKETAGLSANGVRLSVVHDIAREAFGAYRVVVTPSTVVIDSQGKIVHAIAGLPPRYGDILCDALLLAAGKISVEKFEQTLHGPAQDQPDENTQRARRMTRMGVKLLQRGLDTTAEEEFREALKLAPDLIGAQLGLGEALLNQKRYSEAKQQFDSVLRSEPDSPEALIGLAFVYAAPGADDLDKAQRTAQEIIRKHPSQARAHFVLGLVHEQRGRMAEAAACFKAAAELLLKQPPVDSNEEEHG